MTNETAATTRFLADRAFQPIDLTGAAGLRDPRLTLGRGSHALEVVVASAAKRPTTAALSAAWKGRHAGRAAPVLLAVLYEGRAALYGPAGEAPPAQLDLDPGLAERICGEALEAPDRHAAQRGLADSFAALETRIPGLRNQGLFATHELVHGAPRLSEWAGAVDQGRAHLGRRGDDLLRGLGFTWEEHDRVTRILRAQGRSTAVAVLLEPGEAPDQQLQRFSDISPISYALGIADQENLPWVVVLHASKLRLYPARLGVGVGRRGRTETFVELNTTLLATEHAGLLWLLFSAPALAAEGTVARLLEDSQRYAGELAASLRNRIYDRVVPTLAEGIARARNLGTPTADQLAETYQMAMTVLFRALFVAYAEDQDLLPYRWNDAYRRRSLTTKAAELLARQREGHRFGDDPTLWEEFQALCRAVERGKADWGVPAYGGRLFSSDAGISPVGGRLADLELPDSTLGPALTDLLTIGSPDEGAGPVDFRSLGVREFGTIYEGLLESELSLAETDLVEDKKGLYRPARNGETPDVHRSHVYLHNRSGARKATGSYFTPAFAVDHLLDRALEPALDEHRARLDALEDEAAAAAFFDFRVADIAMGSGHFLVAAVDRLERRLAGYLQRRPLPTVQAEIAALRAAAEASLGPLATRVEIEDSQLLRRQIARRCIYGVDLNPIAVDLARVALWIHTFVPGLPLSLLDRTLVCGDSLTGVGRLQEIREKAEEDHLPLFDLDAEKLLAEAIEPLQRVARLADATPADVERARRAWADAERAEAPARALCDITVARRLEGRPLPDLLERWQEVKAKLPGSAEHREAQDALSGLSPVHFPVAFPEVFLRGPRSGFDVILGNPPWDEATVEEDAFWARHQPGLRGLSQREQEQVKAALRDERGDLVQLLEKEQQRAEATRRALLAGPFPGMGAGDPDFYKAFAWRFWQVVHRHGGRIGVVLPRPALMAKGSAEWRQEVFAGATGVDIAALTNRRQWVFPEVHPQYTIGLVALERGDHSGTLSLQGPFASREQFDEGIGAQTATFETAEVLTWSDTAALPLLPTAESVPLFAAMRRQPRLDVDEKGEWRARPYAELHATNDKHLMDIVTAECPEGFWPVYKGESFDLWTPDTGTYYAWADPVVLRRHLHGKRQRAARNRRSPFSEFTATQAGRAWVSDAGTSPSLYARIAFRDVSRATDSRTVRVALVPPRVFIANSAPFFLWPRGDEQDQAYLLGVLSSLPLDWYARRMVENHLNFHVLNALPIPRPERTDPLWRRTVELAGRLACPDERFAEWAGEVGVEWGPLGPDEKDALTHELDAVVAHLYGLNEAQLVHVFETFHEGWDFRPRLAATLAHFQRWGERR